MSSSIVVVAGLLAIAMMRLVVDDDDVLQAHQFFAGALEHLAFGLLGVDRLVAALEQRAADLVDFQHLSPLEARGSW